MRIAVPAASTTVAFPLLPLASIAKRRSPTPKPIYSFIVVEICQDTRERPSFDNQNLKTMILES